MSLAETAVNFGQNETLISSIRNILKDYHPLSLFKEFLQNADDAGATRFHVILDYRSHPVNSLICGEMREWQGPAILIFNNAIFENDDFQSLMNIRVGGKQNDRTMIGKHGLGFNSCYHFTDVPSLISNDSIVFLDPQENFLNKRGIKSPLPRNGIRRSPERDQLVPFENIEGIDFRSTFNGTLFRIPLRKRRSGISNKIFTMEEVKNLFADIKNTIISEFLFLRNIEKIEMSYIPQVRNGIPFQINQIRSLWKASIIDLDEEVRDKRRSRLNDDESRIFQLRIRLIDTEQNNIEHNDHWIIAVGAQNNPEEHEDYAEQHRLSVLGGIAAQLETSIQQIGFIGRMHSFLSLPDITYLPVHLSGTWALSSDRSRLLIENGEFGSDYEKINWNRNILLDFLPKLYCELLNKIIELYNDGGIDLEVHPVSKFWPFPPITLNCPKYAIEYGLKVLHHILQDEDTFRLIDNDDDENERVDILFNLLPRDKAIGLHVLLQNNWDGIGVRSNPDLRSLVRSLPIWRTLSDPLNQESDPPLKAALHGHILPKKIPHYRTRESRIFLEASNDTTRRVLCELEVPLRDVYSYTFEDVEFPTIECDYYYLNFLKSILGNSTINGVLQGLKQKRCFPTFARKLKKINDLYDQNNEVFRIVFGDSDVFLYPDFSVYSGILSTIGFNNTIDQRTFIKCAEKIEELQNDVNPPSDLRYRGFILVDYFYKNIDDFDLEVIERIPFVPIAKSLDLPYSQHYNHTQVLDSFKNIIFPKYKEVAWSTKCLIAEDVIPPPIIFQEYPSLGKPSASIVVRHLRFLHGTIRNDWQDGWAGTFKHNINEIYKWLEEECSNGELNLSDYIRQNDRLFLNFNKNQDPCDPDNWVSAADLILNGTSEEERYVNPNLAIYPNMLRNVGVREITRPNFDIRVRRHNQSNFNQSKMFRYFLDQTSPLHDVTFVMNNDRIKVSRYVLAASSEFFHNELFSGRYSGQSPPITIDIRSFEPIRNIRFSSLRILLRYLHGQSIDHAIQNRQSLNGDDDEQHSAVNDSNNIALYKDLLKMANHFVLNHLKELMELRLSYLVTRTNVQEMKRFASNSGANQLRGFCERFIECNDVN
ncbi:sacsin-like [Rhizophagus clarus]|uniref:Sacsin-like n=1 Tax=Rhizophagus clarus TaxID=94130 RepID=A0A8H3LDQ9_9GLOM|nr:sacsin-like [Rhizophagus clarus]